MDVDALRPLYRERAHLVAFVAGVFRPTTVLSRNDPLQPQCWVVYIHTHRGQLTWHLHDDDLSLFADIPVVVPDDPRARWDGHNTAEKYRRLHELVVELVATTPPPAR